MSFGAAYGRELVNNLIGTADKAIIDIASIGRLLLLTGASCFMVAHNHPGGKVTPSKEDHTVTSKLAELGKLLGIPLIEHLVISRNGYFSFYEHHPSYFGRLEADQVAEVSIC